MNCVPTVPDEWTDDAVLGGRLRLKQRRDGHRVGHDAILLAAACPARPGEHVVEFGAGVGAAGLALAARLCEGEADGQALRLTLLEIDPALAALAAENAKRNGIAAEVKVLDVTAPAGVMAAAGLTPASADCILMNPPFNSQTRQQASPDPLRRLAHMEAEAGILARWMRAAHRVLRPSGTATVIWRADGLAELLASLDGAFGGVTILPVYPKPEAPAIRVLVGARKGSRAPLSLLSGFTLQDREGRPTPEAEAVLRRAAALPLRSV